MSEGLYPTPITQPISILNIAVACGKTTQPISLNSMRGSVIENAPTNSATVAVTETTVPASGAFSFNDFNGKYKKIAYTWSTLTLTDSIAYPASLKNLTYNESVNWHVYSIFINYTGAGYTFAPNKAGFFTENGSVYYATDLANLQIVRFNNIKTSQANTVVQSTVAGTSIVANADGSVAIYSDIFSPDGGANYYGYIRIYTHSNTTVTIATPSRVFYNATGTQLNDGVPQDGLSQTGGTASHTFINLIAGSTDLSTLVYVAYEFVYGAYTNNIFLGVYGSGTLQSIAGGTPTLFLGTGAQIYWNRQFEYVKASGAYTVPITKTTDSTKAPADIRGSRSFDGTLKAVACSPDGTFVIIATDTGICRTCSNVKVANYLPEWENRTYAAMGVTDAQSIPFDSIQCSNDGKLCVACSYGKANSSIYFSKDYGRTWSNAGGPSHTYVSVVCNTSGTRIAAIHTDGTATQIDIERGIVS